MCLRTPCVEQILLVPDGLDRVEIGCLTGLIPAEEDADYRESSNEAPRRSDL